MSPRPILVTLLAAALGLSACGSSGNSKPVNTATYTCGQFTKSLNTKGDNSAGNYINQLVKAAGLKANTDLARKEITAGIALTCRNRPASTRPKAGAIAIAKQIEAGKFKLPPQLQGKKKSNK
jgi:hypothetical protein